MRLHNSRVSFVRLAQFSRASTASAKRASRSAAWTNARTVRPSAEIGRPSDLSRARQFNACAGIFSASVYFPAPRPPAAPRHAESAPRQHVAHRWTVRSYRKNQKWHGVASTINNVLESVRINALFLSSQRAVDQPIQRPAYSKMCFRSFFLLS